MLNRPSLDDLMKMTDRYTLVVGAAKRARILTEQAEKGVVGPTVKPVTQALQEIEARKVRLQSRKQS